jgi:predicted N-acetyltransferase YhbS
MRDQWAKELYVRGEKLGDREVIFEINKLAFGSETESKLIDSLRKGKSYIRGLSLVAVKEEKILGHAILTRAFIVNRGRRFKCLVLGPMAVRPENQKQGVGKKLIEEGFERARELGFSVIAVLGHETYYPKFGFFPASQKNICTSFKVPDENFMVIELAPNALKGISGMVEYPKEFLKMSAEPKLPAASESTEMKEQHPEQQTSNP